MSVHTKTEIRYMLMTLLLSLLPAFSPILPSNFTLWQTWYQLCLCKLSLSILHIIFLNPVPPLALSAQPTYSMFCFGLFLKGGTQLYGTFFPWAPFLQHSVLNGCSDWRAVLLSTTARNRLLCGPGLRRKVEMRYATVPRTHCFCVFLNYAAQSRKDPLKGIKKQEVIANSNPCRCLWMRVWSCITHLWYLEA